MPEVKINSVSYSGDNLYVEGLVDGVRSKGHGWVARANHMSPSQLIEYERELLINGKPADAVKLKVNIEPLTPTDRAALWFQQNWITILVSVTLSGVIDLLIDAITWHKW